MSVLSIEIERISLCNHSLKIEDYTYLGKDCLGRVWTWIRHQILKLQLYGLKGIFEVDLLEKIRVVFEKNIKTIGSINICSSSKFEDQVSLIKESQERQKRVSSLFKKLLSNAFLSPLDPILEIDQPVTSELLESLLKGIKKIKFSIDIAFKLNDADLKKIIENYSDLTLHHSQTRLQSPPQL